LTEGLVKDILHPASKKMVLAFLEAAPKEISFRCRYSDSKRSHCLWSEGL